MDQFIHFLKYHGDIVVLLLALAPLCLLAWQWRIHKRGYEREYASESVGVACLLSPLAALFVLLVIDLLSHRDLAPEPVFAWVVAIAVTLSLGALLWFANAV